MKAFFALVLLTTFIAALPAVAAPAHPNLIVILADDLGRGDYSAFGTKDIRTPNVDRLCREGMTFDNFYANSWCVLAFAGGAADRLLPGPRRRAGPGVPRGGR